MASDEDGGYPPRGARNGPLGARISQRNRASQPPASGFGASYTPAPAYTPNAPFEPSGYEQAATSSGTVGDYTPPGGGPPAQTWGRVTGLLKLDEKVNGALHGDLQFGSNWTSRSEMLRACLDEYYRLVASFNEARRLLELGDADVEALRREKVAAINRLRDVESRLELHSRTELRAVYLGAAEVETRLFRAEEERDLLRGRAELLEGFMAFLSRIIATVRAIPPNVVIAGEGAPTPTTAASPASAAVPQGAPGALANSGPDETTINGARPASPPAAATAAPPATPPNGALLAAPIASTDQDQGQDQDFEELVLDEDEVALLPSNEFEIIEILDEDVEPDASSSSVGSADSGATNALPGEEPDRPAESTAGSAPAGGQSPAGQGGASWQARVDGSM